MSAVTVINCKPTSSVLVSIAKVRRTHPLAQFIEMGGETLPDVFPIIGGNNAQENEYPWHVLIFYFPYNRGTEFVSMCGGTIIDERTILTAAHCCEFDTEQKDGVFRGVAGWYNASLAPAKVFEIEDVRSHKWYKQTDRTVYNDIALLITHDDLDFSTSHAVQPVPYLANRKLDYLATRARNDKCVTIGDGVLVSPTGSQDFEYDDFPEVLQELEGTNLVHYTTCWKALRGTGLTVLPTNICAIDKNQGFCFGDSGGFTGCTNKNGVFYQVAIPSWITSHDCSVGIQVFTRVAKYRKWIEYYKYK